MRRKVGRKAFVRESESGLLGGSLEFLQIKAGVSNKKSTRGIWFICRVTNTRMWPNDWLQTSDFSLTLHPKMTIPHSFFIISSSRPVCCLCLFVGWSAPLNILKWEERSCRLVNRFGMQSCKCGREKRANSWPTAGERRFGTIKRRFRSDSIS